MVYDFHTKWGKRDTPGCFFLKKRLQVCISVILRVVGLLGEKFTLFNSLGTTKISRSLKLSFYINIVQTFQNNWNYASNSNIWEVTKFYNLGDKTFETDFSFSPGFSLPKNPMCVNLALVVRRRKVQLLPFFKVKSGHQSVTTTKTPQYICRYKIGVSVGELDWG